MNLDALIRICLNDDQMKNEFTRPIYSQEIIDKAKKRILTLEDLLGITPSAYVRFYIIAYDRFTSSKKYLNQKHIRLKI